MNKQYLIRIIKEELGMYLNEYGAYGYYGDKFMGRKISKQDQAKIGKAQKAIKDKMDEPFRGPSTIDELRILISLIDPTQISAYPDIPPAINSFKKNPSWKNAAFLTLALLAVIPIIGKAPQIISKAAKAGSKISSSFKGISGGNKIAQKMDKQIEEMYEIAKRGLAPHSKIKDSSSALKDFRDELLLLAKEKPIKKPSRLTTSVVRSASSVSKMAYGETKVLKNDLYMFISAHKGKVSGGTIKPSQGLGSKGDVGMAEDILEKARKKFNPEAVSRQNSTYLTPFSDAGGWSGFGPDVYLVKIPAGSKISKLNGHGSTEAIENLRSLRDLPMGQRGDAAVAQSKGTWKTTEKQKQSAYDSAEAYWQPSKNFDGDYGYTGEYTEIITKANVQVIGKASDLGIPEYILKGLSAEFRSGFKYYQQ